MTNILKKNPMNVGVNIAAGNFQKGLELLSKQIAVVNFDPLKQLFVDTHTLAKVACVHPLEPLHTYQLQHYTLM